jgi:Flp pilus assembly protein TadG
MHSNSGIFQRPWWKVATSGTALKRQACLRRREAGQNLVELVLTLPMVLVMIFFIVEFGRVWMTYQSAKTAAREGVYVASLYHSVKAGQDQMAYKLNVAGVTVKTATVTQVPGKHAYKSDVTVTFESLFGGVQIPTLAGPISILPAQFDLGYKAVTDVAVY